MFPNTVVVHGKNPYVSSHLLDNDDENRFREIKLGGRRLEPPSDTMSSSEIGGLILSPELARVCNNNATKSSTTLLIAMFNSVSSKALVKALISYSCVVLCYIYSFKWKIRWGFGERLFVASRKNSK